MSVLLTFLGRVPKQAYRTTVYTFPDGTRSEPVAFFGWCLQKHLQAKRLVILGTAGSMWDHLFEQDLQLGEAKEAERLRLLEAVEAKAVDYQQHLLPLKPLLESAFGCQVDLKLIPYSWDQAEQIELLRILASCVRCRDTVHLDVTHGFRHLPMLALVAALYLRRIKGAQIAGIWYAAFDPDTGQAPVLELSGLLHLAEWLQALATYDQSGDYSVFAALLGEAGKALEKASFFERTTNPVKARQALSGWQAQPEGDPAYDLFQEELCRRLKWWKQKDRARWEATLARHYLAHGDYLRAAIYGLEAVISHQVAQTGGNLNVFEAREQARQGLQDQAFFSRLNRLRNAMAHGVLASDPETLKALASKDQLTETLQMLFDHLLPK